jgi:hypothetical protein
MAPRFRGRGFAVAAVAAVVVLAFAWSASAQGTTTTVAGTVRDAQGGVIPGATVTLISESQGLTFTTASTADGTFVLTNLPGDTYTIKVEMDGFKTSERKGVLAVPGERVAVGTMAIEVGALSETVTVTGEAPLIQAQTGDRSFTVTAEEVDALPMAGRNFNSFAALTPGVITSVSGTGQLSANRADGARTNYLLDGLSTVDTSAGAGITLNSDAIAQVRVVSSSYQAEYGRTVGLQILGVTKSGTNQFRGSVYDVERRTAWNENTWANLKNGNPMPGANQRDWGFTIGGPVGKPGGGNKLFFFFSQQFQPRTTGGTVRYFRVPTLLERQGDFSQSTDQNGALFNLILDARTGLPCTAANSNGCFRDGGVLGRIPQDRLYDLGLNILKRWPVPNTQGINYNLVTTDPDVPYNTLTEMVRVDWQASSKLRISGKYAGSNNTKYTVPGRIPGWNDTVQPFLSRRHLPSVTIDYVINSAMVLEGVYGMTQRDGTAGNGSEIGGLMMSPYASKISTGLANLPTLYPDPVVPSGTFQDKMVSKLQPPMVVNGVLRAVPQMSWGTRITNAPPNTGYPYYANFQYTDDLAISLTQLWKSHTFKYGYQSQYSYKEQNVGPETTGVLPPEGLINFGNDSNNPLDSGFGFANAALGIFSSYQQLDGIYEPLNLYYNRDFYAQDNWKVNNKLSLDYGMRFTHHDPQYDGRGMASNFFPEQWKATQAPLLYQPGCSVNVTPCPTLNRVAVNPQTGAIVPSAAAIGTIVANSGNLMNGIRKAGDGISKKNYIEPDMVYGPRLGFGYDMTGNQNIVFRGSVGLFWDRPQGNTTFAQAGNYPNARQASLYYSSLPEMAAGTAVVLQAPPTLNVYYYDSKIPSSLAYNAGVQTLLPWQGISVDASYVGTHTYNDIAFGAVATPTGEVPTDRNGPDIGTAYLPQYQDPTRGTSSVPGATAMSTDLLRPYRGVGPVNTTWPRYWKQYDSLQFSMNRRMRNGWSAGGSWTIGLRFTGNTLSPQFVVHNADGTTGFASFQKANDELLQQVGNRQHLIRANFVYQFPEVPSGSNGAGKVVAAIANGWQLSGVVNAQSGSPYDVTYSYSSNGANVNLTGSPNYRARIKINGNTGSGCSSNQYTQYNAGAYQGPTYNSIGNESGTMLLGACMEKTVDFSLSRNISLGGTREVQFRLDAFNAFNIVNYNARSATIQYNSPADPTTIRNNQYTADGSLNSARLTPNTAGAGAATGAMAPRQLQAQIRFYF